MEEYKNLERSELLKLAKTAILSMTEEELKVFGIVWDLTEKQGLDIDQAVIEAKRILNGEEEY